MSNKTNKRNKKQRLKEQKEKQDKQQKQLEQLENQDKEFAKTSHSKSAEKYIKKAKKKCRPFGEPVYFLILKILMLVPFGYSGFFYGGVLAAGVLGGAINDKPPMWVGYLVLSGTAIIGVGIFLAFFKKYIISFVLNGVGTVLYMKSALYMIHKTQKYLSERAVDTALQNLDKEYMRYYYPILGVVVISFALLVCSLVRRKLIAKKKQYEKDTAPVKSIVE